MTKINKATPQEITRLNSESGYLFYTFDPAGLEDIEVIVTQMAKYAPRCSTLWASP